MSAYPPPTKNQTIFNPSNFSGGLGADGSITIDYLNSNYLKYPVAQASNTLAGTTILGNISHTGNMVSTGSIQGASFTANGTDLITEIGTKQDEINTGDLAITDTAGLETTLQGKQPTINDGDLTLERTDGLVSALAGKQPTINDGDLTLERTDGLVSALAGKQPTINTGDLAITDVAELETTLQGKQPTINDGDLTLERTDGLVSALAGKQPTINDGDLTLERTDGLVSALAGKQPTIDPSVSVSCNTLITAGDATIGGNITNNTLTNNTLTTNTIHLGTGRLGVGLNDPAQKAHIKTAFIPALRLDRDRGRVGIQFHRFDAGHGTLLKGFQIGCDAIGANDGTFVISDMEQSLGGVGTPRLTIQNNGDVNMSGNLSTTGNSTITGDLLVGTTNIIDEIGTKQDEINTGDLAITDTAGLESALTAKYDKTGGTITGNATITGELVVNESLNVNNVLTYEKYKQFDTIVVRRPTGVSRDGTDFSIALLELQCWVGGSNIMINQNIVPYFADFDIDKNVDIGFDGDRPATNVNNNQLETGNGGSTSTILIPSVALICKNIPLTFVNDIQAIVYYNRLFFTNERTIGLAIELYNSVNDPNLLEIIATTNEITTGGSVFRFDFPGIDTYPTNSFSTGNSTTQIISDTASSTENAIINDIDTDININTNVILSGDLSITGTITNTGLTTALDGKQPSINSSVSVSCNTLTTTGNITIGGTLSNPNQPCFKAVRINTTETSTAGENLKYNFPVIDTNNAYDGGTFEYIIPVAGNWYFYYSFASGASSIKVQLQQNTIVRDEIDSVVAELGTKWSLGTKGMVILPCSIDDVIRVRVINGDAVLNGTNELHSFGGFLIG